MYKNQTSKSVGRKPDPDQILKDTSKKPSSTDYQSPDIDSVNKRYERAANTAVRSIKEKQIQNLNLEERNTLKKILGILEILSILYYLDLNTLVGNVICN